MPFKFSGKSNEMEEPSGMRLRCKIPCVKGFFERLSDNNLKFGCIYLVIRLGETSLNYMFKYANKISIQGAGYKRLFERTV